MKDLVAIVTVRRLLLELGYVLRPEEPDTLVGPLSLWITAPHADLGGLTPMAALSTPDGEHLVRACLVNLISSARAPSTQSPAAEA